jgi:hypothetical protein
LKILDLRGVSNGLAYLENCLRYLRILSLPYFKEYEELLKDGSLLNIDYIENKIFLIHQ